MEKGMDYGGYAEASNKVIRFTDGSKSTLKNVSGVLIERSHDITIDIEDPHLPKDAPNTF